MLFTPINQLEIADSEKKLTPQLHDKTEDCIYTIVNQPNKT